MAAAAKAAEYHWVDLGLTWYLWRGMHQFQPEPLTLFPSSSSSTKEIETATWLKFPNGGKVTAQEILVSEEKNKSKRAGLWQSTSGIRVVDYLSKVIWNGKITTAGFYPNTFVYSHFFLKIQFLYCFPSSPSPWGSLQITGKFTLPCLFIFFVCSGCNFLGILEFYGEFQQKVD